MLPDEKVLFRFVLFLRLTFAERSLYTRLVKTQDVLFINPLAIL